jgi:hypothetical protein
MPSALCHRQHFPNAIASPRRMSDILLNNCPVDSLPSEILSQIFINLTYDSLYACSIGDKSYGSVHYPTVFTSVSSHWRRVAICTSSLWSHIEFPMVHGLFRNLERVDCFLERSQEAPLCIRIGSFKCICKERRLNDRVASILRSSAPRLRFLAISDRCLSIAKQALSILYSQEAAVPIQELALRVASSYKDAVLVADSDFMPQKSLRMLLAPLRSLYLHTVSLDWALFPCQDLVKIQLIELPHKGSPTIAQFTDILGANLGLRVVRLRKLFLDFAPPGHGFQPIQLPALQKLKLEMNQWFIDWFLKLLVPGGAELSLQLASWPSLKDPSDGINLLPFFQRARITSLDITGNEISLLHVYPSLAYLCVLRFSNQILDVYVFEGMQDAAGVLSKLHTIDLVNCKDYGGIAFGLRSMRSLTSLGRIRFNRCEFFDDGERPEELSGTVQVTDSPELRFSDHTSPFR